ncbi:MAG: 2,3-bisphosphoglycerate-independent phosphoglycerate mutase [Candidatus Gastranaerophilales bacterium]|nr:2,3-bisphosphoglycerate-independent phosphoglycerate mutase [Candidatus Gastranaerophilales bacterium]
MKRTLLCIMDGWGINLNPNTEKYDATKLAPPINVDRLKREEKFTKIHADGEYVGLPDGQMGNSEVGHLNLGAGRVVYQELTKINKSIREGDFFKNDKFLDAINHAKKNNSSLHLLGLVSEGGVHSSMDHIFALIKLASEQGLKDVYLHAFLDGRDTPPRSACIYLEQVENELKKYNLPPITTVSGRYWAMDRDNRWDRVEKAYNCLLLGEGETASSAVEAVENSYVKGDNDEFVQPTTIGGEKSRIHDNDAVIFFNFRPDRAREITKAIKFINFSGFERKAVRKNVYFVTMTQYDETFDFPIAFPPQKLVNILGDVLDAHGIKQFRTAETEKYAHVTFFFNGGVEEPKKLETRVLVQSPKVATYDLQPEMSAYKVCEKVLEAEDNAEYGFILVNFANPDMVGHTGVLEAAKKACSVVDECVGKIAQKAKENGIVMLLTADHGNAELMADEAGAIHTAHTTNEVPFIVINAENVELREGGALCDVAPTILKLMGIEQPAEMTGQSLVKVIK